MKTLNKDQAQHNTLYQRVAADLRERISKEGLTPGEKLPSMRDLCRHYEVSNNTVVLALRELTEQGYLRSRSRSGVYVRDREKRPPELARERAIAIVLPDWDNPFAVELIHGVESQCREAGYLVIVSNAENRLDSLSANLDELTRQVAGLVILPTTAANHRDSYAALIEREVPVVFVDCRVEGLAVPAVTSDNESGGYQVTRHLLGQPEHDREPRPVYLLFGQMQTSSFDERMAGYRRAHDEAGVIYEGTRVRYSPLRHEAAGCVLTREIIGQRRASGESAQPFAIFAGNDTIARGCYVAIREAGLKIPEDVRVAGFDDIFALLIDPPLTTVRQDVREIGNSAARLLLRQLASGKPPRSLLTRVPVELIVRNSSSENAVCTLSSHINRLINDVPTEVVTAESGVGHLNQPAMSSIL